MARAARFYARKEMPKFFPLLFQRESSLLLPHMAASAQPILIA